jgi:hypothetical protein
VQGLFVFDSGEASQQHTSLGLLSLPRRVVQQLMELRDAGLQQGLRRRYFGRRGHCSGDQTIVHTFPETERCWIGRVGCQHVEANSSLR